MYPDDTNRFVILVSIGKPTHEGQYLDDGNLSTIIISIISVMIVIIITNRWVVYYNYVLRKLLL